MIRRCSKPGPATGARRFRVSRAHVRMDIIGRPVAEPAGPSPNWPARGGDWMVVSGGRVGAEAVRQACWSSRCAALLAAVSPGETLVLVVAAAAAPGPPSEAGSTSGAVCAGEAAKAVNDSD